MTAVCRACRRRLTDPASVARGHGPDCWRALHPPAVPTPGRPGPRARTRPGDGQLTLTLPEPPYHPPVYRGRRVQTVPTGGLL